MAASGVLLILLALRGWIATSLALDADESQHLHAAWLVGQGQVPYRDFWENHTPLFYYLVAPLTRWLADQPSVYIAARLAMVGLAGAALILVYQLTRRLGSGVAALAVLLLAVQWRFAEFTTQVRPDVPALVTWVATLVAVVRWREDGPGTRWLWIAGFALGVYAALTPKAAFSGLAVALLVTLLAWAEKWRLRLAASQLGRLAVGATVPVLGVLGWLWATGGPPALQAFARDVVLGNLSFPDMTKRPPAADEGLLIYGLALVGLVLTLRRDGWRAFRSPIHGPLLVTGAVVSTLLLLPTTPAVYPYSWMPVLVVASVYASLGLVAITQGVRASRRSLAAAGTAFVLVVVFLAPVVVTVWNVERRPLQSQLRRMRLELAYACPGEPVLDGTALAVFRPSAYRYQVLVRGVRAWLADNVVLRGELLAEIRQAAAPVVDPDRRLRALGEPLEGFLAAQYVPGPEGLMVAGASIRPPSSREAGSRSIDLLRSGRYRLAFPDGAVLTIDGSLVRPGPIWLTGGSHQLTWRGGLGRIELVLAPCRERLTAGEPG